MDPFFEARLCVAHMKECLRLMQEAGEKGDVETLSIYESIAEKYIDAAQTIMRGGSGEASSLGGSEGTQGSPTGGALPAEEGAPFGC